MHAKHLKVVRGSIKKNNGNINLNDLNSYIVRRISYQLKYLDSFCLFYVNSDFALINYV